LQVRDDQGQCLGLITPSSVLSKISQHRLQSTATH
jgi:glycine betaine/proline transport system ATP-binding protein